LRKRVPLKSPRGPQEFKPWFWSGRLIAKIEAAVVIIVFAGVLSIMVILVQMPGPLVVHVSDDTHEAIKGARVSCTSPDGATRYAGQTDVFGEAKWPGLAKGPWHCEVTPPERFHAAQSHGIATVVSRHPATWLATIERPGRLAVRVVRPTGSPRAAVAVRAVCPPPNAAAPPIEPPARAASASPASASPASASKDDADSVESWESRAGLLDGRAVLWLPHGRACRAGLVRPEVQYEGPVAQPVLDCAQEPCTPELTAGVGEQLEAALSPTAAQWEVVRPPPELDEPEPADAGIITADAGTSAGTAR
jgi:hypothetical protein